MPVRWQSYAVSPSLDPATLAWIAAVGSANVSESRRPIVNALITGLKGYNLWSKFDRHWIFAAENSASALVDIANLQSATPINAPTFTPDRGYSGFANSPSLIYLDTNYNPTTNAVNLSINSTHLSSWVVTDESETGSNFPTCIGQGETNAGGFGVLALDYGITGNISEIRCNQNSTPVGCSVAGRLGAGFRMGTRTAASGAGSQTLYLNGSSVASDSGSDASNFLINQKLFIGNFCNAGSAVSNAVFRNGLIGSISIGAGMTSTDEGNFYSVMRTYMTAVGVP